MGVYLNSDRSKNKNCHRTNEWKPRDDSHVHDVSEETPFLGQAVGVVTAEGGVFSGSGCLDLLSTRGPPS